MQLGGKEMRHGNVTGAPRPGLRGRNARRFPDSLRLFEVLTQFFAKLQPGPREPCFHRRCGSTLGNTTMSIGKRWSWGRAGAGRFESSTCTAINSSRLLERDHSEQSIQPIVRSRCKVKLILLSVVRSPTTEFDPPELVNRNRLARRVLE